MKWFVSIGVVALLLFATACGGSGQQVANCINPNTQEVVPASYCQSNNGGGGSNNSFITGLILYSWLFGGHSYYPMGYQMSPTVINHYHMTTTPAANKNYKTPTGGSIKTDKSGTVSKTVVGTKTQTVTKSAVKTADKITTKTAKPSQPSTSKPSSKPSSPNKSAPSKPSAPKPSSPSRSAPSSGGKR